MPFDLNFAKRLWDSAKTLEDIQSLAGSGGKITSPTEGGQSRVKYHWISDRKGGDADSMSVIVHQDGSFGALLSVSDDQGRGTVIVNGYGAFICKGCEPPTKICGRKPSWVGHARWHCVDAPGCGPGHPRHCVRRSRLISNNPGPVGGG